MKHLLSTGEILYKKNMKSLDEGTLVIDSLEYEKVTEGGEYFAIGKVEDKPAKVKFKIKNDEYQNLLFKYQVKILMQTDLFLSDWESYSIEYDKVKK